MLIPMFTDGSFRNSLAYSRGTGGSLSSSAAACSLPPLSFPSSPPHRRFRPAINILDRSVVNLGEGSLPLTPFHYFYYIEARHYPFSLHVIISFGLYISMPP